MRFNWNDAGATGFIVRYTPDLKRVVSVIRLPWQSAGLTSLATDATGNIYIAGPATDGVAALSSDVKDLSPSTAEAPRGGKEENLSTPQIYVAKLSPDAQRVLWVRRLKAASSAPNVSVNKAGQILFEGPDVRTLTPAGAQLSAVTVPGGPSDTTAINPLDGTIAKGGEHHWPTGREPWRDPYLNTYQPDGTPLYNLYNWPGPYAGHDRLRLVSDSAVRGVQYDSAGNIIFHAWSDGGNSVFTRQPFDVQTEHGAFGRGLGFNIWGANVLSAAYFIKLDKNYNVTLGTLWVAYTPQTATPANKPNSVFVENMGLGADDTVLFAGRSALGLITTGNQIAGGAKAGGPYIAALAADFKSLRFSSPMPGTAKSNVNGTPCGFATGTVKGQPKALYLCGAQENEDVYDLVSPTPLVNAAQPKFGGGATDAYIVLLDLSAKGATP